jgi:hypothetical protein
MTEERIKEINAETVMIVKAMGFAERATFAALEERANELTREWCRAMGLPEDEIAEAEQEYVAAIDRQIGNDIRWERAHGTREKGRAEVRAFLVEFLKRRRLSAEKYR